LESYSLFGQAWFRRFSGIALSSGTSKGSSAVIGLTVVVIGWLYVFGGRSGGRQFSAASVIDRLIFVPVVLLPLATAGVFPHVLVAFTILDMSLAVGAWALLRGPV
jgi:hypothetical protein